MNPQQSEVPYTNQPQTAIGPPDPNGRVPITTEMAMQILEAGNKESLKSFPTQIQIPSEVLYTELDIEHQPRIGANDVGNETDISYRKVHTKPREQDTILPED